jgi:hypothetical protein
MSAGDHYVLCGQSPVLEPDLEAFAQFFDDPANHIVAQVQIGRCFISTIFLGIDHNWRNQGPPLLFETMTFTDGEPGHCERCCTWLEAEEQHARVVAMVEGTLKSDRRL